VIVQAAPGEVAIVIDNLLVALFFANLTYRVANTRLNPFNNKLAACNWQISENI
jgi:hypothetical protein